MEHQKTPLFRGIAAALPTPFTADGAVDTAAFDAQLHRLLAGGIAALAVAGTTGEAGALTEEEYRRLIEAAVRIAAGRVPVIAGAGGTATATALRFATAAAEAGADGLLCVTPYYCKASPAGLVRHFEALEAVGLPIILYNVPGRTGFDLTPENCRELASHPLIAGIKEASGRVDRIARLREVCGPSFPIYCGSDEILLPALAAGGAGAISVTANIAPRLVTELAARFSAGETSRALALSDRLFPLSEVLFREVNPIPVKAALALLGLGEERYRLPLCPPTPETRRQIALVLSQLNLLP